MEVEHGTPRAVGQGKASVLVAAALLAACGTTYVDPPDATVPLRFMGARGPVEIREFPSCNSKTVPRDAWSGIQVRAGKRLYVEQAVEGPTSGCRIAYMFIPRAGSSYTSEFRLKDGICSLGIFEMDIDGRRRPDPTAYRVSPGYC